mmetsp:Transcript_55191/g.124308  ORF Transcript_55191/g.124308 Transcript_55191/m.124308 type:complete len:287 (-) Transcript_55191:182-1042(-)
MRDLEAIKCICHLRIVNGLHQAPEDIEPRDTLGNLFVVVDDVRLGPDPTRACHEVFDELLGFLHCGGALFKPPEDSHGLLVTNAVQNRKHFLGIDGFGQSTVAVEPPKAPLDLVRLRKILALGPTAWLALHGLPAPTGSSRRRSCLRRLLTLLTLFLLLGAVVQHNAACTTDSRLDVACGVPHILRHVLQALQNCHSLSNAKAVQRLPHAHVIDGLGQLARAVQQAHPLRHDAPVIRAGCIRSICGLALLAPCRCPARAGRRILHILHRVWHSRGLLLQLLEDFEG